MGNSCTCINEEQKDRDEFKSVTNSNTQKKIREEDVIKIQANFRGYQARKQFQAMKENANQVDRYVYVEENDIVLNPIIKVRQSSLITILFLGNQ